MPCIFGRSGIRVLNPLATNKVKERSHPYVPFAQAGDCATPLKREGYLIEMAIFCPQVSKRGLDSRYWRLMLRFDDLE